MYARLQNCRSQVHAWGSNKSMIMTFGIGMRAETRGGCPKMNACTRQSLQVEERAEKNIYSNGDRRTNIAVAEKAARVNGSAIAKPKPRVFVAAENRLFGEAHSRGLGKHRESEVGRMEAGESVLEQ